MKRHIGAFSSVMLVIVCQAGCTTSPDATMAVDAYVSECLSRTQVLDAGSDLIVSPVGLHTLEGQPDAVYLDYVVVFAGDGAGEAPECARAARSGVDTRLMAWQESCVQLSVGGEPIPLQHPDFGTVSHWWGVTIACPANPVRIGAS